MNRTLLAAGLVCTGLCTAAATAQQEIYNHFTIVPTLGIAVTTPNWEVGEYVTLAGGAQSIGRVEFNFGAMAANPNGEGTLNLTLYNDQAGVPGTTIATFATPVSLVGTGPIVVGFDIPSLSVPGSVWVAARFVESSGGAAGVRVTTMAPTIGSVSNIRAFREGGVGAWGTDTVNDWMSMRILGSGAACYANCDGSTAPPILNVNDFICFQAAFAAGASYANCDNSTTPPVLNVNDFICFQGRFVQGCP